MQRRSDDAHLQRYLELCQRIYERMAREGSWPWPDSRDPAGMVESDNNPEDP